MIDFQNGIIQKLTKVENDKYYEKIHSFLVDGEEVVLTFKSIRDGVVFTNKRIITINIQGITGKKTDYSSLPYSKIQAFSVETAGIGDWDSELEIYFSGLGKVKLEFNPKVDVLEICELISTAVL